MPVHHPTTFVTVLICTYNGEPFLERQVQSIAQQTRRPDLILINDDHSADRTVEVASHFQEQFGLPIQVTQNSANLNFAKNFIAGLQRITDHSPHHIVFLADQDDAWRPEKIEKFVSAFEADLSVGLVFCDAELADAHLNPTGASFLRGLGVDDTKAIALEKHPLGELLQRNYVQGAACAFRASFIPRVIPIPTVSWHDHWIAMCIGASHHFRLIREPLNLYRQHASQVVGGRPESKLAVALRAARSNDPAKYHRNILEVYEVLQQRLREVEPPVSQKSLRQVDRRVRFCKARLKMRENKLLRPILALQQLLCGNYFSFAQGFTSFAYDLIN